MPKLTRHGQRCLYGLLLALCVIAGAYLRTTWAKSPSPAHAGSSSRRQGATPETGARTDSPGPRRHAAGAFFGGKP
jgi:hypothetical protein